MLIPYYFYKTHNLTTVFVTNLCVGYDVLESVAFPIDKK